MIGEQHALLAGQSPNWTPDEKVAKDIDYMKSEIKSAKDELHKTGYSSEDNLDNKAKLAHYQEQIKLAESGENYTTSFNWKPSEEPSYIDKKLLEQEKQEASEGLSVLQYNARSVNATEQDKEAYDNALNKVLFTTEQIDNINNGQAYQIKEGGPTYSSSTPQQQNNHLAHFTKQLDVMGSESTGFYQQQVSNIESGQSYQLESGGTVFNSTSSNVNGEVGNTASTEQLNSHKAQLESLANSNGQQSTFAKQQIANIESGQTYKVEAGGAIYNDASEHRSTLQSLASQNAALGIKNDFYQTQLDNLNSGKEYKLTKDSDGGNSPTYRNANSEQKQTHLSQFKDIEKKATESGKFYEEQLNNLNSGSDYQTKVDGETYRSVNSNQQSKDLETLKARASNGVSNEDKGWLLEQMNNMQSGKEYKIEQGSDETFKGIFTPYDIPK
jgi:hypothetical protein